MENFKFDKNTDFTNAPLEFICLYNAPSLHTVKKIQKMPETSPNNLKPISCCLRYLTSTF